MIHLDEMIDTNFQSNNCSFGKFFKNRQTNQTCSPPILTAPKQCGYPGSPAHASVSFSTDSMEPGTIATYVCNNGYELLGPQRRLCNNNGTWTPQGIPFCGECFLSFLGLSVFLQDRMILVKFRSGDSQRERFKFLVGLIDSRN